jgi:hypothetical protein
MVMNIAIIVGLFTTAFSHLLGRRWGAVATILGIVLYTFLVGASPCCSCSLGAVSGSLFNYKNPAILIR